MAKILIIDDEPQLRMLLQRLIALEGYEVETAEDGVLGIKLFKHFCPDVVLCDVKLPDGSGLDLISKFKQESPEVEVILLTAYGNIADGVKAIKNGAFDYLTKGDDNSRILPLLRVAVEKVEAVKWKGLDLKGRDREQGLPKSSLDQIIGVSSSLKQSVDLARKVADTDTSVLLTGETGTGKEVFAHAIHAAASRSVKAFVAINCSAFSKELLESELFGYRAGSFTGATKDKKGLLEEADGGTLFLDEVGEMPLELQAKLLRVLESGEFIKIGDTRLSKVNIRVIAATNRDLEKEIEKGCFRQDLYFRLSVFNIHLPSLQERKKDISLYVNYFADFFAKKMGKTLKGISLEYVKLMEKHIWRGNVRELKNVVERSLIMMEKGTLGPETLPLEFLQSVGEGVLPDSLLLEEYERGHILKVLDYTGGNKSEAARLLGIGIATLYRKIEGYGLKK